MPHASNAAFLPPALLGLMAAGLSLVGQGSGWLQLVDV